MTKAEFKTLWEKHGRCIGPVTIGFDDRQHRFLVQMTVRARSWDEIHIQDLNDIPPVQLPSGRCRFETRPERDARHARVVAKYQRWLDEFKEEATAK